ncbi:hypothetical protein [Roseimicrobium sp. ORNL1]|uniref:hypothetical protein n=1 Tax=Roseimicrobium sp. ORNL1 TaxID=2711231 RepID=UPI0013E1FD97|nr:hypothetical protein [Roseimicrobium sp. ORNL1]QIF00564.1 hypothetical protein G5S37_03185 [Roseimicrobium sp. ORNL1]
MKIFRVDADYDFWSLLVEPKDPFWTIPNAFQLQSMRATWTSPNFYPRDPVRTARGDFFNVTLGALGYSKDVAKSALGEIIGYSGEVLPAKLDETGEDIYVFNPMVCYNCLDRSATEARWTPDGKLAITVKRYGFHVDRIGDWNLFKIPETHRVAIYALAGRDEPEDEFYAQYLALGFKGLKFEEVWSNE